MYISGISGQYNYQYYVGGGVFIMVIVYRTQSPLLIIRSPILIPKVFQAGHMVPMDQPAVALQMLNDFIQGALAWA